MKPIPPCSQPLARRAVPALELLRRRASSSSPASSSAAPPHEPFPSSYTCRRALRERPGAPSRPPELRPRRRLLRLRRDPADAAVRLHRPWHPSRAPGLDNSPSGKLDLSGGSTRNVLYSDIKFRVERSIFVLMEGAIPISWNTRIAVVTGGSKGIGLEVCKQLAGSGITVVLTARDETRGTAAVEQIVRLGHSDVIFHQLDITDALSIARLTDFLKARFGKLDILVNNAATDGIEQVLDPVYGSIPGDEKFDGMDAYQRIDWMWANCRETYETAKQGLQTNYYGTKRVTEALLPLLQSSSDGRIVNVSSNFGLLSLFRNEELKQELNDVERLTEERLDELLAMFLQDFEAGAAEARGWPAEFSAYKVAKAAMNAYSRILAKRHPELRLNCAHPGYVRTDITRNSGILTPEEGARNVVKVALLPEDGPTGVYFHEGQEASFV